MAEVQALAAQPRGGSEGASHCLQGSNMKGHRMPSSEKKGETDQKEKNVIMLLLMSFQRWRSSSPSCSCPVRAPMLLGLNTIAHSLTRQERHQRTAAATDLVNRGL